MTKPSLLDLVKYILGLSKSYDTTLGKTRLVKLLYLIEVEYFRYFRERLTNLSWRFWHFGPYPMGIDDLLHEGFAEKSIELGDGQVLKTYELADEAESLPSIDAGIRGIVGRAMERWADTDLNELLNYVYFDTEPMEGTQRGDFLDFSKVRPMSEAKLKDLRIPSEKLASIRERLRKTLAAIPKRQLEEWHTTDTWREGMRIWDETSAHKGKLKLEGKCDVDWQDF